MLIIPVFFSYWNIYCRVWKKFVMSFLFQICAAQIVSHWWFTPIMTNNGCHHYSILYRPPAAEAGDTEMFSVSPSVRDWGHQPQLTSSSILFGLNGPFEYLKQISAANNPVIFWVRSWNVGLKDVEYKTNSTFWHICWENYPHPPPVQ